jgi:hypothetical protein
MMGRIIGGPRAALLDCRWHLQRLVRQQRQQRSGTMHQETIFHVHLSKRHWQQFVVRCYVVEIEHDFL